MQTSSSSGAEYLRSKPAEMGAPPAECDLAVIGGGIVGLAVARELTRRRPDLDAVVLERAPALATAQTGANSGVIHAGIYYAPGSLKARLCVAGAAEMYEFCERHEIPHERCGKVIVARHEGELARLDELERRGQANGVPSLRRLTGAELGLLGGGGRPGGGRGAGGRGGAGRQAAPRVGGGAPAGDTRARFAVFC